MEDFQLQVQNFVRDVQWVLLHNFGKVPADTVTLEFILNLVKAEFREQMDGRILTIGWSACNEVYITVGETTPGRIEYRSAV